MTDTCSCWLIDIAANKTENPVQPVIEFPITIFGKVGCSFQERSVVPTIPMVRILKANGCSLLLPI